MRRAQFVVQGVSCTVGNRCDGEITGIEIDIGGVRL
jgi:hypothetical protein